MGRFLPGSVSVTPRLLAGFVGMFGLLFGLAARADEYKDDEPLLERMHYSLGAGWGREIHENSPHGGGIIIQGRADYPLNSSWSAGLGAGYYWLGSTTTTWNGQTGTVTLAANPVWGELTYDFKGRAMDDDDEGAGDYSEGGFSGLRPYAAVGGGPYWRRTGGDFESENDSSVNFGLNVGLGVDNISHQGEAGIGLEARYHNVIKEGLHGFQMFTFNANVKF